MIARILRPLVVIANREWPVLSKIAAILAIPFAIALVLGTDEDGR